MEDQRATIATLEVLVSELNQERMVRNEEILRLKGQMCEMENMRLEVQDLTEECQTLKSQLKDARSRLEISGLNFVDSPEVRKGFQKDDVDNRLAKNKVAEKIRKVESELDEARNALKDTHTYVNDMKQEIDRTRALEAKAFIEKENLRSKLEEANEEREKIVKELVLLRKQVEFLAEENGKLVGHQNTNQKIQYLVKIKKENVRLTEEVTLLRFENTLLKGNAQ